LRISAYEGIELHRVAESARCQKSTAQGFAATGGKALFFLTWAVSFRVGNDPLQFCVTIVK